MNQLQPRVRLFSERHGLAPEKAPYQEDSLDDELRHALWNAAFKHIFFLFEPDVKEEYKHRTAIYRAILLDFHRHGAHCVEDEYNDEEYDELIGGVQEVYYDGEWNKVFDFIEFMIILASQYDIDVLPFIEACNAALEKECSVYRVVDGKLIRAWEPPSPSQS